MLLKVSPIPRSTALGRRAGLIGVGLLFAGFNTGNNLFYLFFTLLAAAELVGFLVAGRLLRQLRFEIHVPKRARMDLPVRLQLRVENRSRWLPVPALRFKIEAGNGEQTEIATPGLAPGGTGNGSGRLGPARRGWLRIDHVELRTDFPFGLSQRVARLHEIHGTTLVLPRLLPGRRRPSRRKRGDHRFPMHPHSSGEEPIDAREYRAGDDARGIDWKASARTERLVWRERKGEPPRALEVWLDRSGPPGPEFELRVSRAAGATAHAAALGVPVAFQSDECDLPPRAGRLQYRRISEYLALVQAAGERRAS